MKNIACLVASLFVGGVCVTTARADDPSSQVPSTTEILSLQDPDGTPYVISHPRPQALTSDQIDEQHKSDQRAANNQDWLVHTYEQQLQQKNVRDSGSDNTNLYYRLATNKDLSKLAGISTIDVPVSSTEALKTGTTQSSQGTLDLRPDPSIHPKAAAAPTSVFTPLVTPLGAVDAAGLHNFYSSIPAAAAPKKNVDPADLDMPGKVAADSDPLAKESLSFDSLPDDTNSNKTPHHDPLDLVLPTDTNTDRIQKMNDAATTAPGTAKTVAVTHINVTPLQLKLDADPPSPKLVTPNYGRPGIASPYSFLDH